MGNCCRRSGKSPPRSWDSSIHGDIPPTGLDLIRRNFAQADRAGQIDLLISFISYQIEEIKRGAAASISFSGEIESVASYTSLAAQFIDKITEEAEKLNTKNPVRGMGDVASRAMKSIGESHWLFMGVSAVAYAFQSYAMTESNMPEYIELLDNISKLAQGAKELGEATPGETGRLSQAVQVILEGIVICCDCISKGHRSRYSGGQILEKQLEKTRYIMRDIFSSLTLTSLKAITRRLEQSPLRLLEFMPVGIEEQEAQVKALLDMEGSEPAIVVVICGKPGTGKTTLAQSVIQHLDWASTDFKFCRILLDNNTPDKATQIVKVQRDIIHDLTGSKVDLRNSDDGRRELQKIMYNQSCFLFIDNVFDIDYVKQILPKKLSAEMQSKENEPYAKQLNQKPKLRVLITSRQGNLRRVLDIKNYKEYHADYLSSHVARFLLRKTILQHEGEVYKSFDEAGLIDAVADACRGVPSLLKDLGNHLRFNRDKGSYEAVLKAFGYGNLVNFGLGQDSLFHTFFFIYDDMQREAQEAFLDICTYFQGVEWDIVRHTVGREQLEALHRIALITRTNSNTVIVHDMFRAIGLNEAKGSRISNYEEFMDAIEDESNLQNIKGFSLLISDNKIESRHLNAMHNSLRVLHLGDSVGVDGPPCDKSFNNLRYLRLGDVGVFPFQDASKIDNLKVFLNASKPITDCGQLPPSLKIIRYQVPDEPDAFANLQLENLRSFEWFRVKIIQVRLSQEFDQLPASLKILDLSNCKQVPENFSHLTALEHLSLEKCDLKSIPKGLEKLVKLKHLSMNYCTNMDTAGLMLPESLKILDLTSCKRIPDNFSHLNSLEHLTLDKCDMKSLPQGLEKLTRLKHLSMKHCTNMQKKELKLPGTLKVLDLSSCKQVAEIFSAGTDLEHLTLDECDIENFPQGLEQLARLKHLSVNYCTNMTTLSDAIGKLSELKELNMRECEKLRALPNDLSGLSSLQIIDITGCINLNSLPDSFGRLPIQSLNLESLVSLHMLPPSMGNMPFLKTLKLISCISLTSLPDSFVLLEKLEILRIERCNKLAVLPKNFEQLSSLKEMIVEDCLSLKELPDGFQSLPSLKMLSLIRCHRLQNLPEEFGKLACLEELRLKELSLSRLPDGFAHLESLKVLWILNCYRLEKLADGFENLGSLRQVKLKYCSELEGTVMESLVNLQQCELLDIEQSSKLVERWKEMQQREEETYYPTVVITSSIEKKEDSEGQEQCVLAETGEDKFGCFMVEMAADDEDNRQFTFQELHGEIEISQDDHSPSHS